MKKQLDQNPGARDILEDRIVELKLPRIQYFLKAM
ncbi:hypothetical protein ZPR_3290 [Zunongwangia profunda SM-A87]|uniref:Uncharacterized protein n=1 Tax=Zunongwangia profunda (strain DSM 18752 / CCTCC AB 206139 / SM-A87) TaxID=655815 RepID=D5BIX3_ZUNPS|nr:hypothetical protein ZPR_3290 [Zunongwangia profunda SM-A87]